MRQGGCGCMPGVWPDPGALGPEEAAAVRWRGGFLHQAGTLGHSQCSVCLGGRHAAEARVLLDPGQDQPRRGALLDAMFCAPGQQPLAAQRALRWRGECVTALYCATCCHVQGAPARAREGAFR